MSEPYTPTTEHVRDLALRLMNAAEFDRWFASVQAGAWAKGHESGMERVLSGNYSDPEATRDDLASWLNAHHPKPDGSFDVMFEDAHRAQRERDAAVARAEAHAKGATRANIDRDKAYEELTAMTNRAEDLRHSRDEWKARAEKAERDRDEAAIGLVIHKRRGKGKALDQDVTLPLRDLLTIITGERP